MASPNSSVLSVDPNNQTSSRRWTEQEITIVEIYLRDHIETENQQDDQISSPVSMASMWENISEVLNNQGFHRSAKSIQRRFRSRVSVRREQAVAKSESPDDGILFPKLLDASRSQGVILGDLEVGQNSTRTSVGNDEEVDPANNEEVHLTNNEKINLVNEELNLANNEEIGLANDEKIDKMTIEVSSAPKPYVSPYLSIAVLPTKSQDTPGRKATTQLQVDKRENQVKPQKPREHKKQPNRSVDHETRKTFGGPSDEATCKVESSSEQVDGLAVMEKRGSDGGNSLPKIRAKENRPSTDGGSHNDGLSRARLDSLSTLANVPHSEREPLRKKPRMESNLRDSSTRSQYMQSSPHASMTGAREATVPNNASYGPPQSVKHFTHQQQCSIIAAANVQAPQNNNPSLPLRRGQSSMATANAHIPQNNNPSLPLERSQPFKLTASAQDAIRRAQHIAYVNGMAAHSNAQMGPPASIPKPGTAEARQMLPGLTHSNVPHIVSGEPANNSNNRMAASGPGVGAVSFGGGSEESFCRVANEKLQALKGELAALETEKVDKIKEINENNAKIERWMKQISAARQIHAKLGFDMKDGDAKILLAKIQISHLMKEIDAGEKRALRNTGAVGNGNAL